MRILIFSTTSGTFNIPRSILPDTLINLHRSSCKVPVVLVRFERNLDFLDRFSKNPQISNFIKIHSVEAEFFHVDRQTDGRTNMTKLVAFRNFANGPKNGILPCILHKHSQNVLNIVRPPLN